MGRAACRFRQSEVTRLVRGAIAGGMDPSRFKLVLNAAGRPELAPVDVAPVATQADDLETRMKDAFGE